MPLGYPANLLGFVVSGDIAGQTIYTDRFMRKVVFPQAPPTKPPTPMQVIQRCRFATAVANWHAATESQRVGFEQISLKASLCMTGLNLWISVSLQGTVLMLDTLCKQTGIFVDDPPLIPWADSCGNEWPGAPPDGSSSSEDSGSSSGDEGSSSGDEGSSSGD